MGAVTDKMAAADERMNPGVMRLFSLIRRAREIGALTASEEGKKAALYFQGGELIYASLDREYDGLINMLERAGKISKEQARTLLFRWGKESDGERKTPLAIALGYLTLIFLAELVTTFIEPWVGLSLHGGLLMVLLLHTALVSGRLYHRLLLSLTLAPLIRMLSLSMPLLRFPPLYWYLIIGVPLFVATILTARTLGLSRVQLGLTPGKIRWQLLIGMTGLIFGAAEYYILTPEPLIGSFTWQNMIVPALILLSCTGLGEELIFRGVIQRTSMQTLGRFGLLYVALLFATLHLGYRSLVDILFVFGVALFFGWVVQKTGSLLGISLSHGLTNVVLFLVMPFWGG